MKYNVLIFESQGGWGRG